jgi:hypothetical protein
MAGRAQARAARASAAKPKGNLTPKKQISAATVNRVTQFLDGEVVIDQAIHQGIISANMAGHFRALMKADPADTRAYLQRLGLHQASVPASPPVQIAASESDAYPAGALSAAERERIADAREGRQSPIVHGGL